MVSRNSIYPLPRDEALSAHINGDQEKNLKTFLEKAKVLYSHAHENFF